MAYYVSTAIKDVQSPNTLQLGALLAFPAVHFCHLLEYQDSWDQHLDFLPATLPLNSSSDYYDYYDVSSDLFQEAVEEGQQVAGPPSSAASCHGGM